MSISPREVWSSLPADRRGVILDDLAALLREMSHDLGPRHAAAPGVFLHKGTKRDIEFGQGC